MLNLHTAATAACITTAEAKLHLRVDHSTEDALIAALVAAATADAEAIMGRAIMPQKWQLTLSAFPVLLQDSMLRRPLVTAIDSIDYIDTDGASQTLSSGAYQLAAFDFSAVFFPAYGTQWPTARDQPDSVVIVFSCGYADAASVPEVIKAWVKLRVGALYENRESWTAGLKIEPNPFIDRLLDGYRTWG